MRDTDEFDRQLEEALERKKAIVIAGVVAVVSPRLEAVEGRVARVEEKTAELKSDIKRVEDGVAGLYPRLDEKLAAQDVRTDKRLDRMENTLQTFGDDVRDVCDKVTCLVKRNDRKDGGTEAIIQIVRVFWALLGSGVVIETMKWAWQIWKK